MKTRKSISYAYPTSPNACALGYGETGCYYIAVSVFREDASWSPDKPLHNAKGYKTPIDPYLLASYFETEGEACPYFLRHGNKHTLRALKELNPALRKATA